MKNYKGWITSQAFAGSEFQQAHRELEAAQARFLHRHGDLYSNGYLLPTDMPGYTGDHLHSWSRPYEYAYIAANLPGTGGTTLDVGSGFSFFPSYIQDQGNSVTCTDIDDLSRAYEPTGLPFVKDDITDSKLAQSFDTIYSVSVLEHIKDKAAAVHQIYRLLKPGGRLLLTMDCDLGRTMDDTTPCLEDFYGLLGLINHVFESDLAESDLRRDDDLLTTRCFEGANRWRVPWQQATVNYRSGLAFLRALLSAPRKYPDPLPTLAVYVGFWDKKR